MSVISQLDIIMIYHFFVFFLALHATMNHQNFSKMLYDLPQIALISSSNCNTMPLLQLRLQTAFMYSCSCHVQCCTSIVVRVVCRILLKFLDFFWGKKNFGCLIWLVVPNGYWWLLDSLHWWHTFQILLYGYINFLQPLHPVL